MVRIISWNIGGRTAAWNSLIESDADLALLQEAREPPAQIAARLEVDPDPWRTVGVDRNRPWRASIVKLSDRVTVQWLPSKSLTEAGSGELAVSRPGTLAAAIVKPKQGEPFMIFSIYALWEKEHVLAKGRWIYADASVHRLISDLSVFIGERITNVVVAGDLNILYGYGERGNKYWQSRYATVFDRMASLGLPFVGPQTPHGRRADPWPDELPRDSNNVPTYHTRQQTPATCTRQLDFVFASADMRKRMRVSALNEPEQWGPSDHCRILIEVTDPSRPAT